MVEPRRDTFAGEHGQRLPHGRGIVVAPHIDDDLRHGSLSCRPPRPAGIDPHRRGRRLGSLRETQVVRRIDALSQLRNCASASSSSFLEGFSLGFSGRSSRAAIRSGGAIGTSKCGKQPPSSSAVSIQAPAGRTTICLDELSDTNGQILLPLWSAMACHRYS